MSMLSCFFNGLSIRRFKAAKCKTLLEKIVEELELQIEAKENQMMRRQLKIAKLLGIGQEKEARFKARRLIYLKNRRQAMDIIILYCQQIVVQLPLIESQRECPPNAKEAISSLCFAAPRFNEPPGLLKVLSQFSIKYGKKFTYAALELEPNCRVNKQMVELLTIYPPSEKEINESLKEIAVEFKLKWAPPAVDENMISAFAPDLMSEDKMQIVLFTPDVMQVVLDEISAPNRMQILPDWMQIVPSAPDEIQIHT